MMEARFLYKCRLCGKTDENLCAGADQAMPELIAAMTGRNDGPAAWNRGFPVRMADIHHCAGPGPRQHGERVGVADLIGYKIVDTCRRLPKSRKACLHKVSACAVRFR